MPCNSFSDSSKTKQRKHSLVLLLPFLSLWCLTDENLCHSLEGNAGALTNFEVLDFLRDKGASKDPTRVIARSLNTRFMIIWLTLLPLFKQERASMSS
ncbi:hypothetical protein glysoja_019659 [Glycine soja]|nr:hypothetical protein glysoja_019659 [Glycine soja]